VIGYGLELEKDAHANNVKVVFVDQDFETQLHDATEYLLGTV